MSHPIDWPPGRSIPRTPPRRRRNRRRIFFIVLVLLVLLFGGRTALSYYVDALWFGSLGYGEVFRKSLSLQWTIFATFAAATFLFLYGSFLALKRAHFPDLPSDHTIFIGTRPVTLPVEPVLRLVALVIAFAIALITGAAMMAQWPTFALDWYASRTTNVADPILGKALNFYLFSLPAWQLIASWLMALAVITCVVAVFFLLLSGGARALDRSRGRYLPLPWRGFSLTFSFLLLVIALQVYLGRFERLFADHTVFGGATYTDAHVTLTGLLIVCVALIVGAIIAAFNVISVPRARWLVAAIVPAILCYFVVQIFGWYVSSFIVKPNELDRERPYIAHNIELTRQAYGLDRVSRHEFPAEVSVEATDAAGNQATLQNIRLWDWRALQDTLRQIQEIRTYYDFPDIDIDRYDIDGKMRQVMLATRELSVDKLP